MTFMCDRVCRRRAAMLDATQERYRAHPESGRPCGARSASRRNTSPLRSHARAVHVSTRLSLELSRLQAHPATLATAQPQARGSPQHHPRPPWRQPATHPPSLASPQRRSPSSVKLLAERVAAAAARRGPQRAVAAVARHAALRGGWFGARHVGARQRSRGSPRVVRVPSPAQLRRAPALPAPPPPRPPARRPPPAPPGRSRAKSTPRRPPALGGACAPRRGLRAGAALSVTRATRRAAPLSPQTWAVGPVERERGRRCCQAHVSALSSQRAHPARVRGRVRRWAARHPHRTCRPRPSPPG